MARNLSLLRLVVAVIGGWCGLSVAQAAPTPSFHVVDLGAGVFGGDSSVAASVNNAGQIVGYARDSAGQYRAAYWAGNGSPPVNLDAGRPAASYAFQINPSGRIVGQFGVPGGYHAAYWPDSNSALQDLGTFSGGTNSSAAGINSYGEVVGYAEGCSCGRDGNGPFSGAAYWGDLSLPPSRLATDGSRANAISDSYGIVGSGPDFAPLATVWSSAGAEWQLGTLGPGACCSAAFDINESGQIVGCDYTSIGQTRLSDFWPDLFSAPVPLGGLGGDFDNPRANKINESGQIVGWWGTTNGGYHAVLWLNSTSPPVDLNTVLSSNAGLELYQALGINDAGEIVGIAVTNGTYHAVALIPDAALPDVTNCIQNICFIASGIHATPTGTVGSVTLRLPIGFSVGGEVAGPDTLQFWVDSNVLGFTPDGGLLAYGSNGPSTLRWGYVTNNHFAQEASLVSTGANHMPGIFLKGDQGAANNAEAAAMLLFTGWGDATDPAHSERLGSNNYVAGLANYAGLNFRAPPCEPRGSSASAGGARSKSLITVQTPLAL